MKKTVAWVSVMVLVCAMFFCLQIAVAEDDVIEIDPVYLNTLKCSADEWYSNSGYRELFVTCMIVDGSSQWGEEETNIAAEACVSNTVYLTQEDNTVSAFVFGKNDLMIFRYNASSHEAFYLTTKLESASSLSQTYMKLLLEKDTFSSYQSVDCEAVLTTIAELVN